MIVLWARAYHPCTTRLMQMSTLTLELARLKINVNSLAPGMLLSPFSQPAVWP